MPLGEKMEKPDAEPAGSERMEVILVGNGHIPMYCDWPWSFVVKISVDFSPIALGDRTLLPERGVLVSFAECEGLSVAGAGVGAGVGAGRAG